MQQCCDGLERLDKKGWNRSKIAKKSQERIEE